jgi:hypothetical protein
MKSISLFPEESPLCSTAVTNGVKVSNWIWPCTHSFISGRLFSSFLLLKLGVGFFFVPCAARFVKNIWLSNLFGMYKLISCVYFQSNNTNKHVFGSLAICLFIPVFVNVLLLQFLFASTVSPTGIMTIIITFARNMRKFYISFILVYIYFYSLYK